MREKKSNENIVYEILKMLEGKTMDEILDILFEVQDKTRKQAIYKGE